MYAALIGDTIDYVIFEGVNHKYPTWFEEKVLPYIVEDVSRYPLLINSPIYPDTGSVMEDESVTEGWDVFLQNSKGDVLKVEYDTFYKNYEQLTDYKAAMNRDVIQYTIYEGYGDILPTHFKIYGHDSVLQNVLDFLNDVDGELLEQSVLVILLNKNEETYYMDVEKFERHYVSNMFPNGGIIRNTCSSDNIPSEDELPW